MSDDRISASGASARPPTIPAWIDKIGDATRDAIVLALPQYIGTPRASRDNVRRLVIEAARIALGDSPEDDLNSALDAYNSECDRPESWPPVPHLAPAPTVLAATFRLHISEDLAYWRSAIGAETIMVRIQRVLDEELADRPITDDGGLMDNITMILVGEVKRRKAANGEDDEQIRSSVEDLIKTGVAKLGVEPVQVEAMGNTIREMIDRVLGGDDLDTERIADRMISERGLWDNEDDE